jgi:hypothetical protein
MNRVLLYYIDYFIFNKNLQYYRNTMKASIKNIMVIAVITTILTISPSILSSNAFAQNYQNDNSGNNDQSGNNDNSGNNDQSGNNDNSGNNDQSGNLQVEITSPNDGDTVNTGELTITGTSSDTSNTDCHVYADWNNESPYQLVDPKGNDGNDDYSKWKFTYTDDYHTITQGNTNELTAKFYCGSNSDKSVSEYDTINVIGE